MPRHKRSEHEVRGVRCENCLQPWPVDDDWKENERCLIGGCKLCGRHNAILVPLVEFEPDLPVGICTICRQKRRG